jgi:hypothetical protein
VKKYKMRKRERGEGEAGKIFSKPPIDGITFVLVFFLPGTNVTTFIPGQATTRYKCEARTFVLDKATTRYKCEAFVSGGEETRRA